MGEMSGVKIILLCEDRQTQSFVRNFLKHRNFKDHDFTILCASRASKGSAEQWVRKKYPKQLNAIRSKKNAYLIVVIDADTHTIDDRRKQLGEACEDNKPNKIPLRNHRTDTNVLHIIPRRNIETWLAYLDGMDVDESTVYPKLEHEGDCRKHARRLYDMCHRDQSLREPAPLSLQEACKEYRKLQR